MMDLYFLSELRQSLRYWWRETLATPDDLQVNLMGGQARLDPEFLSAFNLTASDMRTVFTGNKTTAPHLTSLHNGTRPATDISWFYLFLQSLTIRVLESLSALHQLKPYRPAFISDNYLTVLDTLSLSAASLRCAFKSTFESTFESHLYIGIAPDLGSPSIPLHIDMCRLRPSQNPKRAFGFTNSKGDRGRFVEFHDRQMPCNWE